MAQEDNIKTHPIHPSTLGKRMLVGAGISLLISLFFVLGVDDPKPEWHALWIVKPLLIIPAAGALGGAFFHFMDHLRYEGGWRLILANVLSVLVYLVVVWLGIVLGLHGTMWD